MKKNSGNFQKKLKSYSVLAGTIVAANQVSAQVVYTDIIPDSTVNTDGGMYNLDLNNDGSVDFAFNLTVTTSSSYTVNKVGVNALNSNMVAGNATLAYIYPTAMNPGDTVGAALTWNIGSSMSMGSYFGSPNSFGNFLGTTDKYIGLKLDVSGVTYYGWARLDVDSIATSFTIKDYAYMNNPGQPIVIGALTTGIEKDQISNVTVYNDNRVIHINNPLSEPISVSITNSLGQQVYSKTQNSGETQISLDNAVFGIYFVNVRTPETNYTKKILIK